MCSQKSKSDVKVGRVGKKYDTSQLQCEGTEANEEIINILACCLLLLPPLLCLNLLFLPQMDMNSGARFRSWDLWVMSPTR